MGSSTSEPAMAKSADASAMPVAANTTASRKQVLVDMDGVLSDFESQFLEKWRETYPEAAWLPLDRRRTHYVDKDPSGVYDWPRTHQVIRAAGFYETMPPIP